MSVWKHCLTWGHFERNIQELYWYALIWHCTISNWSIYVCLSSDKFCWGIYDYIVSIAWHMSCRCCEETYACFTSQWMFISTNNQFLTCNIITNGCTSLYRFRKSNSVNIRQCLFGAFTLLLLPLVKFCFVCPPTNEKYSPHLAVCQCCRHACYKYRHTGTWDQYYFAHRSAIETTEQWILRIDIVSVIIFTQCFSGSAKHAFLSTTLPNEKSDRKQFL